MATGPRAYATVSLSPSQCLKQLFILYRVHYTPHWLYSWGRSDCVANRVLLSIWFGVALTSTVTGAIFQILNSICFVQVTPDNKLAVLGIIPEEVLPAEFSLLWTRALYIAHKLILQKWLLLSLSTTLQLHNTNLRRGKLTHKHRGYHKQISKAFEPWLSSA